MKKFEVTNILIFLVIAFSAIIACKKNRQDQPIPQKKDSIMIGNHYYQTTRIENQIWTTVNYAGPGGKNYDASGKNPEYGRYYNFDEIKKISLPGGWRLPTMQDYVTLARQQGVVITDFRATAQQEIKKLTSMTNWRSVSGINSSGFNAYPAGYCFQDGQPIDGDIAEFWTAEGGTVSIQENADRRTLNLIFYKNDDSDKYRFNLRFIRDKK